MPADTAQRVEARPVIRAHYLLDALNSAPSSTADDVTIDGDGERIDTPEKARALVTRENARRAAEGRARHDAREAEQDGPALDVPTLVRVLDRHGAEVLVVGGVGALAYDARRGTRGLDFLVRCEEQNLERLAAAMREPGARLRVEGLSSDTVNQPKQKWGSGADGDSARYYRERCQ